MSQTYRVMKNVDRRLNSYITTWVQVSLMKQAMTDNWEVICNKLLVLSKDDIHVSPFLFREIYEQSTNPLDHSSTI